MVPGTLPALVPEAWPLMAPLSGWQNKAAGIVFTLYRRGRRFDKAICLNMIEHASDDRQALHKIKSLGGRGPGPCGGGGRGPTFRSAMFPMDSKGAPVVAGTNASQIAVCYATKGNGGGAMGNVPNFGRPICQPKPVLIMLCFSRSSAPAFFPIRGTTNASASAR
jgi:hypothetical protein